MAEEEKNEQAAADPAAEGEEKVSGIKKLLGSKLIIPIAMVLGMAAGGGVMLLVGGHDAPPPEEGENAQAGEGAAQQAAPHGESGPDLEEEADKLAKADYAQEKESSPEGVQEGGEAAPAGAHLIKFDPLVVNIFEKNSIHYLKLQLELAVSTEEVIAEIETEKARLRDRLLFIFSDTTLREVLSTGGKALLKEDIQIAFNKILSKGKVTQIYFTDFTVQ